MRTSLKIAAIGLGGGLTVAGVAAGLASTAGAQSGDRPDALVLRAAVAPSQPEPTDPAIFGATPGAYPWSLREGHVRIGQDGSLEVDVNGLVVSTTGVNPISELAASVYCNGTLVATTAPVPFSSDGDARLRATVSLPTACLGPAVLLNPAPNGTVTTTTYIAYDGTSPLTAAAPHEQDAQGQQGQGHNHGHKGSDHDGDR